MRPVVVLAALSFLAVACEKKKPAAPAGTAPAATAPAATAPAPAKTPPAATAPGAAPAAKAAVKPIPPDGALIPGLSFEGKTAEAIDWYKKILGATEVSRMASPGGKGVMHAHLKLSGSNLFLGDAMPGMTIAWPQGKQRPPSGLYLYVADVDDTYKKAVEAGAKGLGAPRDMFWGDRYSNIIDPFGHHWSLATHKEDLSNDEIAKRGAEWTKKMMEKHQKK